MLKLMYITNRPEIAQIAESAGVDRVFVDLEYIGKSARQGGMDTVQSRHTVQDVATIRTAINTAELLVRVNPIHDATTDYTSSEEEIASVIAAGADVVMLPYFKTAEEVQRFISAIDGKARAMLLFETAEAVENIESILSIPGIDEVYVGLNDLSLSYGMKFMFQLLADGTVDRLAARFKQQGLPFGFGGIAALGKGALPSEYVIREHYRLGSTCAILSRSFCNTNLITHLGQISTTFIDGVREIRALETECRQHLDYFTTNRTIVQEKVAAFINA